MLAFLSAPNHMRHLPQGLGEKVNRLLRTLKLISTDFSQISAHASGAWRHSQLLVLFPIWGFILTSVNDASSWTPVLMLHLTSPCTKRKVLSLTKPKGKIYIKRNPSAIILHCHNFSGCRLSIYYHQAMW